MRKLRRLEREQRRLATLTRLQLEQRERVQQLEKLLHPPQPLRLPVVVPAPQEPLPMGPHGTQPWTVETLVGPPGPQEEEPMPDPVQEIALELGLPPRPS